MRIPLVRSVDRSPRMNHPFKIAPVKAKRENPKTVTTKEDTKEYRKRREEGGEEEGRRYVGRVRGCQSERNTCVPLSIIYRTGPPVGATLEITMRRYVSDCWNSTLCRGGSPSGASSWTDKCRRRECFLELMTRCPTRAWMAFLLGLLFPDFRFHSVSFYSPLPTTVRASDHRGNLLPTRVFRRASTRWRTNVLQTRSNFALTNFCVTFETLLVR